MKCREGKIPEGKGIFLWYLYRLADGNMEKLAETLFMEGYHWVCVKVVQGRDIFDAQPDKRFPTQQELLSQLVHYLKPYHIDLHGWGWHYGGALYQLGGRFPSQVTKEASRVIEMVKKWPLQSYMINGEWPFKRPGGRTWAVNLVKEIRGAMATKGDNISDLPLGFSSYRFPKSHPQVPWNVFGLYCDYWSPQVYWEGAHNPEAQLKRSIEQHREIADLPIIPAGSAYPNSSIGWKPTIEGLRKFNNAVRAEGLPGILYWEYEYMEREPAWKEEIASHSWPRPGEEPGPPPDPPTPQEDKQAIRDQAFQDAADTIVNLKGS